MSAEDSPLSSFASGDPSASSISTSTEPIEVYDNGHGNGNSPSDELDSLPSTDTDDTLDDERGESDAEREWRESLQQLELLLTMVLVPYLGKYFGRKAAYWGESHEGSQALVSQIGDGC